MIQEKVEKEEYYKEYHIMLLLSSNIPTDMEEFTQELVRSSNLPMSVIIVGIGDEDFSSLEELAENKSHAFDYYRENSSRNVLNFVFLKDSSDNNQPLYERALKEIPQQFMEYMVLERIYPSSLSFNAEFKF